MEQQAPLQEAAVVAHEGAAPWQPPAFEVVSLSCEITAYAPDEEPLF